ncbi:hypothetical protein [uncultured Brevundimonas sp.]|uniref:hypothetical protein n=1 Tax=uncultured Brevundimonas sp. TaxID=213418 RepID=UPI002633ED1B|nr:hypothetical protein [uncultured Brevundimonas sp.]
MKRGTAIALAVAALFAASEAAACLPEEPPVWSDLFSENGPPIAIVRTARLVRTETPRFDEYFEIWDDTATVQVLDVIQGRPKAEYSITAVGDYKRRIDSRMMFCWDRMDLELGEVAFGFERSDGSFRTFYAPRIPAEYHDRIPTRFQYLLERTR